MTTKKVTIKFTAYKDFEYSTDDPLDLLKSFCEDHDLEFEDSVLLDTRDECPMCGKFEKDIQCVETKEGIEIEGCQSCIDNYEPEEADEDHNSDR